MRVCMVAYTFYEPDNRVRRYAETLVRRGDKVDAIVLRQPGQQTRTVVSGVNVYKIQGRKLNEKMKIQYLLKLLLFLFKSACKLTQLHRKKKYDVIHVHSVPDFEVFATLFAKLTGAKVILDIHDIVPELFAGNSSWKDLFFQASFVWRKYPALLTCDSSIILVSKADRAFSCSGKMFGGDELSRSINIYYQKTKQRNIGSICHDLSWYIEYSSGARNCNKGG